MRSSHRKSRNGCRECKQRHKKCDESWPTCLNCSITSRPCSYRLTRPSHRSYGLKIPTPPATPSPSAISPSPSTLSSLTQCHTQEWQAQAYSLAHLKLLHHFESRGFEEASMIQLPASMRQVIMQCALTSPYLMDQILALSAAHLSTLHRGQQQIFFRNQAMELQTRALTLFNRSELGISEQNSCSWFLYASFLGLHVMFETFQCSNFDVFLEQLATYFPVHRGVSVVIKQSWPAIKGIVEEVVGQRDISGRGFAKGHSHEFDGILSLIDDSDLEEADKEACVEAADILHWVFKLHHTHQGTQFQIHFTIAWSILVPARFGEMLRKRVPEALIILSFHAVLLHRLRKFWIFGESGRFLIQSISTHLGTRWARWMIWPNEQLNATI
ncbi:hypothetical protein BBK36DRAFT_1116184 [Trichoderma citrinoviride]|uniref:Zn(2)-C6 fungal-type domain-containing protein n=1 Tax=Trichoderma citrinoviride TaxID=58853 RepID=A0A2T4BEP5_9HYPO|nr:hypothetical protein BBK36DRAFT_1116184 [Trichoderma citrinoviride]PTB67776.1 hypothetical protein BBK36DRAFT_1116184 [Trichoderma citrinoviride]